MTVPAGRVVPWERKLMSWGTVKIMSLTEVSRFFLISWKKDSLRETAVLDHVAVQGSLDLQFSWIRDNGGRCNDGS
jgi:hypothetical protein